MSTKQLTNSKSTLLKMQADLYAMAEIAKADKSLSLYVSLNLALEHLNDVLENPEFKTAETNEYYWEKY